MTAPRRNETMPINDEIDQLLGMIEEPTSDSKAQTPQPVQKAEALRPIEEPIRTLDATPEPQNQPAPVVDISKMFEQMGAVTNDVLQCAKDDRNQAEAAIQLMNNAIEEAHSLGKPASKTYVEGLVKAIEVKANINTTVVKIMEANAKLFAATKSGLNLQINNQNSTVSSDELVNLLNTPLDLENEP